jgi:CheY-like chemotaxis protein
MLTIPAKNYTIVVADDDDDDQYLIGEAIRETISGHRLHTVNNGLELVNLLSDSEQPEPQPAPDLILLDLNMPKLDGYSVLQYIRGNERLRSVPVYVLSTSRFEHDRLKSMEFGANDFYSKPYQFEKLKSIITDICYRTFCPEGGLN